MRKWIWIVAIHLAGVLVPQSDSSPRAAPAQQTPVYVDGAGVIRWTENQNEVALFGANYCLPSACDYRAAGYVGADRKKLIDQDMAHFARMRFDALRLSFWGDWENSDEQGNLIANEHLDLMDYLIAQAGKRGIYMLLSPIVTHSSLWPDLRDDPKVRGFSRHFQKSELGTNPQAIAAQANYLKQLLNHVNPYTGVAIKDEHNILFVEMINEPWHHSDDDDGSVRYINALVDAVRDTGCKKLTFHNISQDFGMARSIHDSRVDGSSFAWYPSGLNAGRELHGNFLRFVDSYPHMTEPLIAAKPRIVYEFDMPDVISGYHYPAMARTFRQAGAQWATMFSYDMLATAPYNLGWQTHLLNLVYTPKKAASAVIAGEVMRRLPRLGSYGPYPQNTRFGDFRVSYEQDLAELAARDAFMYSNNTSTNPPAPDELKRILGFGSSPIVQYDGAGVYFLDRVDDARWRLEVYPDVFQVADPFNHPQVGRQCFRLVAQLRAMTIHLPSLGPDFSTEPLNAGNTHRPTVESGKLSVLPGVYLLTRAGAANGELPEALNGVGLREFVCPEAQTAPPATTQPTASQSSGSGAVVLFDAEQDAEAFSQTRAGWSKPRLVSNETSNRKALVVDYPAEAKFVPEDFSRLMYVGDRIHAASKLNALSITLKGHSEQSLVHVILIDKDGAAFEAAIQPGLQFKTVSVPLLDLKPTKWAMLPQAYPNGMVYFASMPDTTRLDPSMIERLELSLRKQDVGDADAKEFGADVQSVWLELKSQ